MTRVPRVPSWLWLVAAFVPMVGSQLLRLSQSDPVLWVACDYGGRLGALAVLALIPAARAVAFRGGPRTVGAGEVAGWLAGFLAVALLMFVDDAVGITAPLDQATRLARYPKLTGWLYLVDLTAGIALLAVHEEIVFRRCARAVFRPLVGDGAAMVVATALLFAAYHWWSGLGNIAIAGLWGVLAMACYRRCGVLWPVVLAHYLTDAILFA
ncbi:MAG: CPBP family intramembrane metalloprotease [Proteobacteria bacterium]|nr:CPBP family intramembrane metalloprotease [Pseudomonadota bacterium]